MGKNGIPDRWLDYSNFGSVIEGTRIVALKVPLKQVLLNKVDVKERFSPEMAAGGIPKLDFIIDLTYTKRYYSPAEFQSRGVGHSKIATEGHVIPNGAVLRRFFDTMDAYLADQSRTGVIGVHCTHGVNRTGYMVCRYMISRLDFTPDQAIIAFNKARGHDLERANYLEDLRTANWPELPEAEEGPEQLADRPAGERYQEQRERWTMRRHRRDERRDMVGPYGRPPPPPPGCGPRWWHGAPPGHRLWRPPPPWVGADWRLRGPPPPRPPWLRPDGGGWWRHGPPPPPLPPPNADEDGPSSQDTDDQWQPESPAATAAPVDDNDDRPPATENAPPRRDKSPAAAEVTRPVTRVLQSFTERCPVVAGGGTPETETVIILSDDEPGSAAPSRAAGVLTDRGDRAAEKEKETDRTSPVVGSAEMTNKTASPVTTNTSEEASGVRMTPGAGKDRVSPGGKSGVAKDRTSPAAAPRRIVAQEADAGAPPRHGFRQRAADAGWCWGNRR